MKHTDIITKIRHLQSLRVGGEPDPVWLRSAREALLARARQDNGEARRPHTLRDRLAHFRLLLPRRLNAYVIKPALISTLVLGLALGGWVTTVSASYGSLPGDPLYGFKLAAEKAQVTLTPNSNTKAMLRVEFVGRRVDEVAKIVENSGPAKAARVSTAVHKMKEEITVVQQNLDTLKASNPGKAIEVAKLVDRKTAEFQESLKKTEASAPSEVKGDVKAASEVVGDTSVKAVAAIVEAHVSGAAPGSPEEVKTKVDEKIQLLSEKVVKMEHTLSLEGAATSTASSPAQETTQQAKSALDEAKALLEQNDLGGAMGKVIEGKELAKAAEAEAVAATAQIGVEKTSVASSTPSGLPERAGAASSTSPLPATVVSSTPKEAASTSTAR